MRFGKVTHDFYDEEAILDYVYGGGADGRVFGDNKEDKNRIKRSNLLAHFLR